MSRSIRIAALVLALAAVPATALAAVRGLAPGKWQPLADAPVALDGASGVWTGKQIVVVGRAGGVPTAFGYDRAENWWSRLARPPADVSTTQHALVWTGSAVLAFGGNGAASYDPRANQWRRLPRSLPTGTVVWTGREAIGWGGGCCGDFRAGGAAYEPSTGRFRNLPRSPLAASQHPIAAWTGRELVVFVSAFGPDGKRWPRRFALAAAYDPRANRWHRITAPRTGAEDLLGNAVWDGREVLVAAVGPRLRTTLAYDPRRDTWRMLRSMPSGRVDATAVWTGTRLLLWGGEVTGACGGMVAKRGLAFDPRANAWTVVPQGPLRPRDGAVVVSAGRALVVWGGEVGTPGGTSIAPARLVDGAAFVPDVG